MCDVHGIEHGVDVNAATIRGQRGQVEAWEVASMKLVEEVCNFLREVAQLAQLAEPHLISAHHLLPSQRPPTNVVTPPTSKMVGDLTPALRSGPDIAADAETAAISSGVSARAAVKQCRILSVRKHLNYMQSGFLL